jgi:hypothetical protein
MTLGGQALNILIPNYVSPAIAHIGYKQFILMDQSGHQGGRHRATLGEAAVALKDGRMGLPDDRQQPLFQIRFAGVIIIVQDFLNSKAAGHLAGGCPADAIGHYQQPAMPVQIYYLGRFKVTGQFSLRPGQARLAELTHFDRAFIYR